ncbi:hypothetical protein JQC67_00700 [Aurantibacter crassamenti]|uniref:hypothetical protein n=1 Tax=Aurantibacter crassamenti TaxID=1837375 RepID=UPI00193AB571|nr:hypothetical protein [Aurantibacter crassamenti]MBM1104643.1 hypothetical protein [Aurantibacter crassamenti]
MNVQEFSQLLQHPDDAISQDATNDLADVLATYPYFQAARALHLKGLKNNHSFKYNDALKVTAAHTADRDILFEFITSPEFIQNSIADTISGKTTPLVETDVVLEEIIPEKKEGKSLIEPSEDAPLPRNLKDADTILDPKLFKSKKEAEKELELGAPLPFTKKEKYSFSEWLQVTTLKSIDRSETKPVVEEAEIEPIEFPLEEDPTKKKKFDLIDRFLEDKPKIEPKENVAQVKIKDSVKIDKNELMTVTLARVYLEQKKYKNAIQAYKILSLKYPEKSGFFADRIRAVKKLQQENK